MLFQDALAQRLGVMHPSRDDLQRFLAGHPPQISPGIPQLVGALRAAGKQVFLVSGGFRIVIHPIAEAREELRWARWAPCAVIAGCTALLRACRGVDQATGPSHAAADAGHPD